jgi:hypothetical protein
MPLTAKEYQRQLARRAAAHALVACELGVPLDHVSVLPERDAALYYVKDAADDDSGDATFNEPAPESLAAVDYAGHAATVVLRSAGNMRATSANINGTRGDFERASSRLDGNACAIEDAKFRALEIVARRHREIEHLADVIAERGTLDHAELVWLLDQAQAPRRKARSGLRMATPAPQRLAA